MASVTAPAQNLALGEAVGDESARFRGVAWPSMPGYAAFAAILSVAGVVCILPTALYLWSLWTTDPLKSLGGFVPFVSLVLILRVWQTLAWERDGTWWGFGVLCATALVVHWREHAVLELVLSPSWSTFLPPHSLVAFSYVSGVVLLFGGPRLYRAALFPIALILLVNPVPHIFNRYIDLPLQHASALIARSFAHELGQPLTSDQLRLMFTPDFGMFIAPGCNGIRGSLTMGFIALIAGYLYRFRARVCLAVVAAAVLLGYLFNLCRLCVLVLYYVVALHFPWLQDRAELGDYLIGAALFLIATLLLCAVIQRFNSGELRFPKLPDLSSFTPPSSTSAWARSTVFGMLILLCAVSAADGVTKRYTSPPGAVHAVFPAEIGRYALQRTWPETLDTGQTIFQWAEYRKPGGESAIRVGISPVLGAHDTLLCHSARGEDWLWHGNLQLRTAQGNVDFSSALYSDKVTQYLEATTVCSGLKCGQWTTGRRHLGLVYSRTEPHSLFGLDSSRPIPVLLRAETTDSSIAPSSARSLLTKQLQDFVGNASLSSLTYPYREP